MLDLHTGRRRKENNNNNKKNETKTNNEEKNIPTAAKTHCMQVKAIMLLTLFLSPHAFKIGCIIHQNIRSAPICFLRWQYTTTTYFFNMPALHRNKPSRSFPPRSPKPGDHWLHLGFTAYPEATNWIPYSLLTFMSSLTPADQTSLKKGSPRSALQLGVIYLGFELCWPAESTWQHWHTGII